MAIVPSFIPGGDSINNAVSRFLDGFEVGIETIRRIDYGAQYLWTIDFIGDNNFGPPAPFDAFFPASEVTFPTAISNNLTFAMGQSSFSVPRNSAHKTVDITFYDDENASLQRWMTDWIELDIYNAGQFVSGLDDIHRIVRADSFGSADRSVVPRREIKIAFLDRLKSEALVYNYSIVPNGEITVTASQSSDAMSFSMKFDIVEEFGRPKPNDNGAFKLVKTALGRFI